MAVTYKRFEQLGLDTSVLGLECGDDNQPYFCTPKGARIIGWAGVDGIHFCFIRGFGEMVFAVSPMNTPGDYVHPLAERFEDFLCLLLSCGDTAALEQAHGWTQAQFDVFLLENPISPEQQTVLGTIAEKLKLTPMEQPYSYLKKLQTNFDYSRIHFTGEYAEVVPEEPKLPEWKVYYDGNFWGHHGHGRAGTEIPVGKRFDWGERTWLIPAIYPTAKGLVIDFCMRVPQEQIRAFLEKWDLSPEQDGSDLSDEQRMLADAENPLSVDFRAEVTLNHHTLHQKHGCGLCWNPCFPELNGLEAKAVLVHYGLAPDCGWEIHRLMFPWETKRKPQIKTLAIHLEPNPVALPGMHFHVSAPGEEIRFIHPLTKAEHTLTVQECERQELPPTAFPDRSCEYPTHYIAMSYTVTPELPIGKLTLQDCAHGDRPKQKQADPLAPEATYDCCVGIIGGTDGSTAVFITGSSQGRIHTTCSSLHFDPIDDVEWCMVFQEKMAEDIDIIVIE